MQHDSDLTVLKGPNAAFRELQMTIKPGENKPWHDKRVRLAVNHAINRADIIRRVYSGEAEYSGHVPPGYGPWPLKDAELRKKYLKFDLPKAKKLMADAGYREGLLGHDDDVRPAGLPADLGGRPVAAQGDQHRRQHRRPGGGHVRRQQRPRDFDWDLTGRGMRGDVDGYVAEFHPAAPVFKIWYPEYRNVKAWRGIGNGRIQLDPDKRLPIYQAAQRELLLNPVQIPLVAIKKYQVIRKRVKNMYVAFSDFNTGLRNVWLNGDATAVPSTRRGAAAAASLRRSGPLGTGRAWPATSSSGSLFAIPTLIGVSIGIFLMVRLLPGDIIDILFGGDQTASEEVKDQAREQLGLNGSYAEQYWRWISGVVQGDFGFSLRNTEPVSNILVDALAVTLELVILALLIATLIGVPLGVLSAVKRDSAADYGARVGGLIGLSIPSFWLATLLLLFTSRVFGWVPPLTYISPWDDPIGNLSQFILPAISISVFTMAIVMRMVRDDDARGARAGLRPHRPRQGRRPEDRRSPSTRCGTP